MDGIWIIVVVAVGVAVLWGLSRARGDARSETSGGSWGASSFTGGCDDGGHHGGGSWGGNDSGGCDSGGFDGGGCDCGGGDGGGGGGGD